MENTLKVGDKVHHYMHSNCWRTCVISSVNGSKAFAEYGENKRVVEFDSRVSGEHCIVNSDFCNEFGNWFLETPELLEVMEKQNQFYLNN